MHALVQEGALWPAGAGQRARIPWWRSQAYYDSGAWRGTWALDGGGVLMNQSIHSIDLLQWLMGPVHSVYAYTDTLAHRMETEDVAVAVLRFANGALGTIAATTGRLSRRVTTRIEVFGDQGSAVIENDRLRYLHLARDDTKRSAPTATLLAEPEPRPPAGSAARPRRAARSAPTPLQIADMIRAIREDGTPLVDG